VTWPATPPTRFARATAPLVIGRLKTRAWETPEGERHSVVEVEAEEVGPSLRWATATPQRAAKTKTSGQFNDDPPR
jgi:single-strand DNA-binding protein